MNRAYAAVNPDDGVREASSSGGVFSALAARVLAQRGIVVGAIWDEDWNVVHSVARSAAEVERMRGSKYAPSAIGGCIGKIRAALAARKKVLFVGVPCQTAAVRKMFGEDPNLTVCALICMCTPEKDVWRRYVQDIQREAESRITEIRCRDKMDGWKRSRMVVRFENGSKSIEQLLYDNPYFKALALAPRQVCMNCQFKGNRCRADLQIGDFWGLEDVLPSWDDGKGVSAVLAYTENGLNLMEGCGLRLIRVEYEQVVAKNPYLARPYVPNVRARARFLRAYRKIGVAHAVRYACEGPLILRVARRCYRLFRQLFRG